MMRRLQWTHSWRRKLAFSGDTRYVYAVKTTGVYCRLFCSSWLSLRANVVFFGTSVEAERARDTSCRYTGTLWIASITSAVCNSLTGGCSIHTMLLNETGLPAPLYFGRCLWGCRKQLGTQCRQDSPAGIISLFI
jgi:hypothetical protein